MRTQNFSDGLLLHYLPVQQYCYGGIYRTIFYLIDGFIQAIGKINNSTEKEGLNDILFCLIEITKRYNEKGNTCHIYRGKRSDYLDVLSKVDLEGIEKVKKFISDANELSY